MNYLFSEICVCEPRADGTGIQNLLFSKAHKKKDFIKVNYDLLSLEVFNRDSWTKVVVIKINQKPPDRQIKA